MNTLTRTILLSNSRAFSRCSDGRSNTLFERKSLSLNLFSKGRCFSVNQKEKYSSSNSLSPAVKHLLAIHNIGDPFGIVGTGPKGRLLKGDVLQFIATGKKSVPSPSASTQPTTKQPSPNNVKGVTTVGVFQDLPQSELNKAMAASFLQSKSTIPHLYMTTEVNIDEVLNLQKEINERSPSVKLGMNEFLLRASALALREVPQANAIWSKEEEVKFNKNIHISVSLKSTNGMVTPTIRHVDSHGLVSISQHIKELLSRADASQLSKDDLEDGVFSVSCGEVDILTELVKPSQSAIIAVGKGRKTVVPDENGNISIATLCEVTLSADRRIIDEELAGKFLNSFRKYLSQPHLM